MKLVRSWVWLLVLIPLGLGVARLRFDVEVLNLLPGDLPVVQGLKSYQENFSNARELIITLEAPGAENAESAAGRLAQMLRAETNLVARVVWQPAWREYPGQAAELIAYLWFNQPPVLFAEMIDRLSPEHRLDTLRETREKLATSMSPSDIAFGGYDPYGLMRLPESLTDSATSVGSGEELFASADGSFRVMFVEAKPGVVSYKACRAWIDQIKKIVTNSRASGAVSHDVKIRFTGRPAFVTEIAGGMEKDIAGSGGGTLAIIGILFYLTHRRIRPLLWLLALLLLMLGATMALGGLIFGTLNVVSMGFASILAGLAEDFGIVLYQESRSHPELSISQVRQAAEPGIYWSAITTAGAFLLLNLSGLPGLGQLGSLVAIGIIVAAFTMLYVYLPLLFRSRRKRDSITLDHSLSERLLLFAPLKLLPSRIIWAMTAVLLLLASALLIVRPTRFDRSPDPLKPKNSEAYDAVQQIKSKLGRTEEPLWVVIPGKTEQEVATRLDRVSSWLRQSTSDHLIRGYTLPESLWPRVENQLRNRVLLRSIIPQQESLRSAAIDAGFATNALFLTAQIFHNWEAAAASTNTYWPTNAASRWVFEKLVAKPAEGFLALGLIRPTTAPALAKKFSASLPRELKIEGVLLSGWRFLGPAVFDVVVRNLPRVLMPIAFVVVASLWLAFRSLKEVILSLAALLLSGVSLWAAMGLLGWEWNLLNLMGLPLLLGLGVDFSIHMQLALRRYSGDRLAVRRSVGRALLLAGSTTVVGFGSLVFSTNSGMASLGKVCALGIALALLVSVYLLPVWWNTVSLPEKAG